MPNQSQNHHQLKVLFIQVKNNNCKIKSQKEVKLTVAKVRMKVIVASERVGFEDSKEADLIIKIKGMILLLRNLSDWKFGIMMGVDSLKIVWVNSHCGIVVVWYGMACGFGDF